MKGSVEIYQLPYGGYSWRIDSKGIYIYRDTDMEYATCKTARVGALRVANKLGIEITNVSYEY